MTIRDRIQSDAANVVTGHGMRDELCVVVWMEGGHMKVMSPDGRSADIARMLYRAADVFADRSPSSPVNNINLRG